MQIENHKEEVPFAHYEAQFKALEPQAVLVRLKSVRWDGDKFYVNLLGREYAISHPACAVTPAAPIPVQTFLLRYLLECKDVAWDGSWKTFREMPWGEMYIQPYSGRVLTRAAFTFGTRLAAFKAACGKMGAEAVNHGDAGFQFELLPGYSMQLLVWEGDEEFPPNAQVLYSGNFAEAFAAEDRVVAGDILISVIKSFM